MEGTETLTEEQIAAKQTEIDAAKKTELSEEELDALVEKRLGGKPSDFIKKSEQVKVLSEEEKKELQEKEDSEALKFGLENNYVSKKEYDLFLELKATNKIDIARKKFIAQNTELGEDAAGTFDRILKLHEDDEIEDGEKMIPNKEKKAAIAWAEKMADEEIDSTLGKKIKGLPEKFKAFKAEQELRQANTGIITKAISELPKRLEIDVEGEKIGIDLTEEDFKEAENLAIEGVVTKKGLTSEEIKSTANVYLFTKRAKDLFSEINKIAYNKGVENTRRGNSGIPLEKETTGGVGSGKREALKKAGIID